MANRHNVLLTSSLAIALWNAPARALDIGPLLDTCPQHDPAYMQIRSDFDIRRNGVPVGDIPCTDPITAAQETDELITVQTLRAALYMDLGTTQLPWAPGMRLYDWMKAQNTGININDSATGSSCCANIGGKNFITVAPKTSSTKAAELSWYVLQLNVSLFAHELRHVAGPGHVGCCSAGAGACDQTYDESNLSSYGVQYWLDKHWLSGELYNGYSCLDATNISNAANFELTEANGERSRFCDTIPPLLTLPTTPGGTCRTSLHAIDLFIVVDLSGSFFDDLPTFQSQAPAIISHLTSENSDIHVGLGAFQDYPISPFGDASLGDKAYTRVVDLTSDTSSVLSTIAGLTVTLGAGADDPQSQLAALYQAATGAGQDLSGSGFSGASIPAGQQANFRTGATKIVLLWTDAAFHRPNDPGTIPYPGPSFATTIAALQALDPAHVIGISSGTGAVSDLQTIASATGAVAPAGGVDCDGDGTIDVAAGAPLVCSISTSGVGIGSAVQALVDGEVSEATPVARCQDVTVTAGAGICNAPASIDAGSSDPGGGPVTLLQSPPAPYPLGVNPVTLTATGTNGLSSTCVANVNVVDTAPPQITLGASTVSLCTSRPQDVTIPTPTIFDACATASIAATGQVVSIHGKSITPIPLTNFHATLPLGSIVVRWTATDPSGNQSQVDQTVQITNTVTASCCSAAQTVLLGTSGNDDIEAPLSPLSRPYCALALSGNDEVETRNGDDFVSGADGDDFLNAENGNDVAVGGLGNDQIEGGELGTFKAYGGPGNDTLEADLCQSSELFGNEGNDIIFGSPGSDVIYPGPGKDQVFADGGNDTVTILNVCEVAQFELLDGGLGNDTLITPVPIATLRSMGVTVTGFEKVVVDASQVAMSECF